MTGDLLLDTSVVVGMLRGDKLMAEKIKGRRVFLTPTVLGELLYGATKSRTSEQDFAAVMRLATGVTVLPITVDSAAAYAQVRRGLQMAGKPIPEGDLWIAACAIQNGVPLATRDEHFRWIEHLQIEWW